MELNKFKHEFDIDPIKANEGVEVMVGEGFSIRVARVGNDKATALYRDSMAAPEIEIWRRSGMADKPTQSPEMEAKLKDIVYEMYSRTILIGWRGLTENGAEVPYSPEKAKELLKLPEFYSLVKNIAEASENFRRDTVKGAVEVLGKF